MGTWDHIVEQKPVRQIHGVTGCPKGVGPAEIEDSETVSVRVVDTADKLVALRIGTHPESARLTPEEARYIANLLSESASRAESRL